MDKIEFKFSRATCAKAGYKPSCCFLGFWDALKTDMTASYRVVLYLQRCYAWVVTSNAVHNYWKCYINVVTRMCLGFYWYIRTLSWVLHALRGRTYSSVKSLAAVLQYIKVCTSFMKCDQIWEKPASMHTITRHAFHHQTIAVHVD